MVLLKQRLTIVIFHITFFFSYPSKANDVWFVTTLNWQPYSGAEMINEGNAVQKLKNKLKENNIESLFEFYPWSRAQKQAIQPGYLGYFPAWPEEVKEGFIASPPIEWSQVAVMAMRNSNIKFDNEMELFRKYTVGLVRTYVYPESITIAASKFPENVFYADNELLLVKKLSAGRHVTAITDPLVMTYVAEQNSIEGIATIKVLYKKPLVIAMTDNAANQIRIEKIQQIFQQQLSQE